MTPEFATPIIKAFLSAIRENLEQAAAIAKAAETCAESASIEKAVSIALDVEELAHDANTLLNALALVNRRSRA